MVSVSASYLMDKTKHRPKIAIICGSGLGKILFNSFYCNNILNTELFINFQIILLEINACKGEIKYFNPNGIKFVQFQNYLLIEYSQSLSAVRHN